MLLCLAFTRSTYTMDHETRIDFKARKSVFERNSSTQAMSPAINIEDQKKKTSTRSKSRGKTILEKSSIPNDVTIPVDGKSLSEPENDVCVAFQGLDLSSVQHIGAILQSKRTILEQINGRDITVILGNTGSGKSTMINFLARAPMLVDINGNFIPQDGRERVKVRAGGVSVTKFPELVLGTEIGDLCDLPGFQDSGGAVDDLLNAVFMREVLTRAKSVRALMITTQAELKAVRADPFRKLSIFMNMFSKREFRNSSCYLIVNRVERNLISQGRTSSLFEGAYGNLEGKDLFLKELIDSGRVFFIPAARAPETDEEAEKEREKILAVYEEMVRRVISISGEKIRTPEINMELTFNADTHQALSMFFYSLMEETFAQHKLHFFGEGNSADQNHKDRVWREFEVILRRNSSFEMLHDFGSRAYESISSVFRKTFEGEYDLHQQAVLAKNLQEEASRAEENRKQAERRQKEAEQELLLAIERKKELEKLRLEAENRAKHHSLEADKAWARVDESRESIRKAEEAAEKAIKLAQTARENVQQNEHEKAAAIENARKKTEELERLRQQARENELKKKEAADKTKQAEQELKRIEEEQIHHRNRCQEMEEFQQRIDKQMRDSKKTKEEAERKLAELETELKSTQERLTSRDKIFEQLRTEVESLRRDQGEVSALRREIENLRRQLVDKDGEIRELEKRQERIQTFARGHEDVYRKFLGGKLIYKPDPSSDRVKIELLIADLDNPLEAEFYLSGCGDSKRYISIHTGYKKRGEVSANKVEIWLTPRFVVERDLRGSSSHFSSVLDSRRWGIDDWREETIGVFYTYPWFSGLRDLNFDYSTTQSSRSFRDTSLSELWEQAHRNRMRYEDRGSWNPPFWFIPKNYEMTGLLRELARFSFHL